jgi:beta-1,2-mannobiose phosphorylase / 1,2-beta-oligomannan phosphorylase
LTPETAEEIDGVVPNVVFPTGVDDRGSGRVDVYYGMADQRIGVARLHVPVSLPCDMDHANTCASLQRLVATAAPIGA